MSLRAKVDLVIFAAVCLAGIFAIKNAVAIGDWWHFRSYQPEAAIIQLAEDAGMNEHGMHLFYRFSPQLVNEEQISEVCGQVRLGCIQGSNIYLLEDSGKEGHYQMVVTAAHEMLHVAYDRLSKSEKTKVNRLVKAYLDKPESSGLISKLQTYPKEDFLIEAYSFIGSEIADIGLELEAHYSQFFSNRRKSVQAHAQSPEFR